MKRDALSLSLPELRVKLNDDSSLSIESVDQNTPSRMIVAEFMILYNWLAARFCSDNQIPILFRRQPEPSERLSLEETGYVYYVFQQRRKLSPLQIDTSPGPHSGIGLNLYTNVTSPLRRYLDLVIQRQIGSFIAGDKLVYGEKELEEIRVFVEPVIRNLQLARRNRQRYWILKFLSQHQGETYRAVILDELKSKYRIVLSDFFLVTEIKRRNGKILGPGQEILVEVKKSDPWGDELKLSYVFG
jgi:exoribonuclease-2